MRIDEIAEATNHLGQLTDKARSQGGSAAKQSVFEALSFSCRYLSSLDFDVLQQDLNRLVATGSPTEANEKVPALSFLRQDRRLFQRFLDLERGILVGAGSDPVLVDWIIDQVMFPPWALSAEGRMYRDCEGSLLRLRHTVCNLSDKGLPGQTWRQLLQGAAYATTGILVVAANVAYGALLAPVGAAASGSAGAALVVHGVKQLSGDG